MAIRIEFDSVVFISLSVVSQIVRIQFILIDVGYPSKVGHL